MNGPRILVWLQEDRGEIAASSWGVARLAARFAASAGGSAVGAVLTAANPLPERLDSSCGLETIWSVRHDQLALYTQEAYLAALRTLWTVSSADLFLTVATPDGQDLAVALSLDAGLPCATRATALHWDGDAAEVDQALPMDRGARAVLMPGGRGCAALDLGLLESGLPPAGASAEANANLFSSSSRVSSFGEGFAVRSYLVPPVSMVSPQAVLGGGRSPVSPSGGGRGPELIEMEVEIGPPRWPSLALEAADPSTVDVSEAELVVAGGRGFETAAGFEEIWNLAETLGAAVGVTRPVVDEGWAPFERQIGQTARYLHARAYLGLGISGAMHHTAGVADCGLVVAVNHDPSAPIFQVADVGFVADVHEVTRALREEVARRRGHEPDRSGGVTEENGL